MEIKAKLRFCCHLHKLKLIKVTTYYEISYFGFNFDLKSTLYHNTVSCLYPAPCCHHDFYSKIFLVNQNIADEQCMSTLITWSQY